MKTATVALLACLLAVGCTTPVVPSSSRQRLTLAQYCAYIKSIGRTSRFCPTDPAPAEPVDTAPSSSKVDACLAAHNTERSAVGVPALTWSTALESTAQQWADTIKDGSFRHNQGVFPDTGENLYRTSARLSQTSYTRMHQGWIDEKQYFKNGVFPDDVSTTGRWADVGHYTAMIWRTTTQVGCAAAEGTQGTTFVCHYKPPGNIFGRKTF